MCYVNINSTMKIYKDDIIVDTLTIDNQDKPELKKVVIKIDFGFIGSTNEEHARTNIVNQNGRLECILRLKKKVGEFNKKIKSFEIDTKDYDIKSDGFLWFNASEYIIIETLPLPEAYKGEYYFDLVVKRVVCIEDDSNECNDASFQIQARNILNLI